MKKNYANMISWSSVFINFYLLTLVIFNEYDYPYALLGIFIAAFFDVFDGKVARMFQGDDAPTLFGELTDSLCDVINFGFIPAFIMVAKFTPLNIYVTAVAFLFIWGGIFRLARFSVLPKSSTYTGLPITIAGPLLAIIITYSNQYLIVVGASLILTYLMVSRLKVKKIF